MFLFNSSLNTSAFRIGTLFIQRSVLVPISVRNYAARKGTRERKRKQKVKTEIKKVGFIPHNQRNKEKFLSNRVTRKVDDSYMRTPTDDVFVNKFYRWIIYSFADAVHCHRETHHPTVYNKPDAFLNVSIELNMMAAKKDKFVDNFSRIVTIPNKFDHGETRSIIVLTKVADIQDNLRQAGAHLVGGAELIKDIENGSVSLHDFDHILVDPGILPELAKIRGLIPKRKYPNPKNGTLTTDLLNSLHKFLHGVSYSALKDEHEQDFGLIETTIGTINMDIKKLEENFACLIQDVNQVRPLREGTFISRCLLWSPPSREKLKVDYSNYLLARNNAISDEEGDVEDDEVATA